MPLQSLPIGHLSEHLSIMATPEGWLLADTSFKPFEPSIAKLTPLGRNLLPFLNDLEDAGYLIEGTELHQKLLTPQGVYRLYANPDDSGIPDDGLKLPSMVGLLPPIAPLTLILGNTAYLGGPNTRLEVCWQSGAYEAFPTRVGCVVQWGRGVFTLRQEVFEIAAGAERYNHWADTAFIAEDALFELANRVLRHVDPQAEQKTVELSGPLRNERIIVPSQLRLSFETDSDGRLTVVPWAFLEPPPDKEIQPAAYQAAEKSAQAQWRQWLFQHDTAPRVLMASTDDRTHLRVVLQPEVRKVLTHSRIALSGLTGDAKDRAITRPADCFEGICDADVIVTDIEDYGPRVTGLGPFVFEPFPSLGPASSSVLTGYQNDTATSPARPWLIRGKTPDGQTEVIELSSREAMEDFQTKLNEALIHQQSTVTITDKTGVPHILPISPILADQVDALLLTHPKKSGASFPTGSDAKPSGQFYLQILTNIDTLSYQELGQLGKGRCPVFLKPESLAERVSWSTDGSEEPFALKPYQQEGVHWLQTSFLIGRPGVLLADDMGLGKTVQVLTFLAWLAESGWRQMFQEISSRWHPDGPTVRAVPGSKGNAIRQAEHPVLIVAPVSLLKNWEEELERFILSPILRPSVILTDSVLRHFRRPGVKGQEYHSGETALDTERLRQHSVVITNYETVVNYQRSFANIRWSVLVTDESQAVKNKNKTSQALKAVASHCRFKIAMTGTPIETRLMELWNILDLCTPGLLEAATEFHKTYEQVESEKAADQLNHLRARLGMTSPDLGAKAVLGRMKEHHLQAELPPKNIKVITYQLSPAQWEDHRNRVAALQTNGKKGWQLQAVQTLMRLYQHPALDSEDWREASLEKLLADWPKFQELERLLRKIVRQGEKVLIFSILVDMQQLLTRLLNERFGIENPVFNSTLPATSKSGKTRQSEIERFSKSTGFNALVLSPEVAGVGLNITAANHIIHYGRWWNPALEEQATCRAYRLRQKRPVTVYYFLAQAPDEDALTFEQRLHEKLINRIQLRNDFLTPLGELTTSETSDLLLDFQANTPGLEQTTRLGLEDLMRLTGIQFEAVTAALLRRIYPQCRVYLTPPSHDEGADVIMRNGKVVTLVQCKLGGNEDDFKTSLQKAFDYYSSTIFPLSQGFTFKQMAVTPKVKPKVFLWKQQAEWEWVDGARLKSWLRDYPLTMQDVYQIEETRLQRLDEMIFDS